MAKQVSAVWLLARRFLLSRSSDGFLSFIAWVSVVGVALGVLALTVVTSVVNGFEGELTKIISGLNGDVILYSRNEAVSEPELIEQKIRRILPEATAVTRSFVTELMVAGPHGVGGAVLEGVELQTLGEVTVVPRRVTAGLLPERPNEVALGASLADRIGASVGSEIRLILPLAEETAKGGSKTSDRDLELRMAAPRSVKALVVGVVKMGMYEYDSKYVFGTLAGVQDFLGQPGKVTTFKLKLKSGADSRVASNRLTENFGYPFRSKDWAQLNKNLFYAIKLEKVVIAIILTVIVIVAAFNVVSTLMMMIHDKTKEIAILKAMGFRPGQSFRLFCLVGFGMGLVGTVVGMSLGLGVSWLLHQTRWINLPSEIYYIGYLPVVVRWSEVGLIGVIALVIAFVAAAYPGWKVARRSPLDGLRYE
ncbi:MAG: FtsX-like permease family protein [Oligoflexia bacterium]|nr:FtsX-like permease family protein [Oligoflexia bacterium]